MPINRMGATFYFSSHSEVITITIFYFTLNNPDPPDCGPDNKTVKQKMVIMNSSERDEQ